MRKQFLSVIIIGLFALLAVASGTQKLGMYTFSDARTVEAPNDKGDYVQTTDGERHYGGKITVQKGLLVRDLVKINGEKLKMDDVYGYRAGDHFFIRRGTDFPLRIVRGAINVYQLISVRETTTIDPSGRSHTSTSRYVYNFAEKDENGKLLPLDNMDQIRKIVEGCPQALELASVSDKQVRKLVKKDRDYLNSIFETYNVSCGGGH